MPVTPKAANTAGTASAGSPSATTALQTAASAATGVCGDGQSMDVAAWAPLGLHPRLLAEVQRLAPAAARACASAAPDTTEKNAEPTGDKDAATLQELALCLSTAPTALIARVLTRTTSDFADVLVDARCACGVDAHRQGIVKKSNTPGSVSAATASPSSAATGTTAAIWMDRGAASATATTAAPTAADGSCSSEPPGAEQSVWRRDPSGVGRALFNRPSAVAERRLLAVLYALHALLTASTASHPSGTAAAAEASSDSHGMEAAGVMVAATVQSARLFSTSFHTLARACGVELVVVEDGEQPPAASPSTSGAARLYVTSMPGFLQWDYGSFIRGPHKDTAAGTSGKSSSKPADGAARFLVVLAAEDVAYSLCHTNELLGNPDSALAKCATLAGAGELGTGSGVGGSFSARVRTNAAGTWPAAEKAWDAALAVVQVHADQRAVASSGNSNNNSNNNNSNNSSSSSPLRFPFFFWLTLSPISCLSPLARSRLSRRNRRYYPLTTSTYLSAAESSITASGPGTTAPLSSTRMVYLFSTDDKDKEAQLQTILKQTHLFKRVLLLTHHKEVRQLYSLIQRWGIYATSTPGHGEESAASANASSTTGTAGRQFFVQRTDLPERSTNSLLDFCAPTPPSSAATAPTGGGSGGAAQDVGGAGLLVGWDSFTAVDLMDVDCVIQYFPPQKSLTDREWTEFIQNLHTTADTEADTEFSLYSNLNNTEKNIHMKARQLQEELGPCGSATSHFRSAARRHAVPKAEAEQTTLGAPITAGGTARCGIRPPTVVTMMGPPDLSLTAFFMQQYYYSGARGFLSPAAASASLAAAVQTGGGATGLSESVVASHAAAHVPVLNIGATHPWFVPLVCGGPALPAAQESHLARLKMGTDGKPVTVTTVLRKKIALERCEQLRAGRDPSAAMPHVIPCLFQGRATPRSDEKPGVIGAIGGGGGGAGFPNAPSTTAPPTSSTAAAMTAGKGTNVPAGFSGMPVPRSAAVALAASGLTGGANANANNNNNNNKGNQNNSSGNNNNKNAGGKDRASPATAVSQADSAKKKGQQQQQQQSQKDANSGGDGGKDKQEEARAQAQADSSNAGGSKGNHRKNRSRKKGGNSGGGDGNAS